MTTMDVSGVLVCTCVVMSFDQSGAVLTKKTLKKATVECGRNQFEDVVLRISYTDGIQGPFTIRQYKIHKKLIDEGKATINMLSQNIQIFLSNCATEQLHLFLRTLTVKVKARGLKQGIKQHMSGDISTQFIEISPLNIKDLELAHIHVSTCNKENVPTTPSRSVVPKTLKRKLCELETDPTNSRHKNDGPPLAKKPLLLQSSASCLSEEQLHIVNIIKQGQSVFITGSAGTGKSYLLQRIIGMLPPDTTYCTGSTGAAACLINGTTLHSFAGIGTGSGSLEQCSSLASRDHKICHWKRCKILIVDEISMIDGDYFDKIEAVARKVRNSKEPFGGIQLILCGDFLQLPPVSKDGQKKTFCFQARSWKRCITHSVELTKVYRQNDTKFIAVLQNIRIGRCPPAVAKLLQSTENQKIEKFGIHPTRLFTHTLDVESTNGREMSKLVGESKTFEAIDNQPNHLEHINTLCPAQKSLELKIGAQVMLVKNIDVSKRLVNGARGIVTSFEEKGLPKVKFTSGHHEIIGPEKWTFCMGGGNVLTRKQIPLTLAWAISIHKSQGMTLDCAEISLGRTFEKGQAYVALSRAKCLQTIRVKDFSPNCVQADSEVLEYYRCLRKIKRELIITD